MAHYTINRVQEIPIGIDEAWDFFSSPRNLKELTPGTIGFRQLSNSGSELMYAGQLITYTIAPVLGIPLFWMTEITHVQDKKYFIDEQRYGPYSLWNHSHFFRQIPGGIEMKDLVQYKLPMGWLGDLGNHLLVKHQLKEIFDFREKQIAKIFGTLSAAK